MEQVVSLFCAGWNIQPTDTRTVFRGCWLLHIGWLRAKGPVIWRAPICINFFLVLGISCDWILEVCHYSQFERLEVRPGVPGLLPKYAKLICKLFSTDLSPHESISEHFGISFPDLEKAAALVDILTEISLFWGLLSQIRWGLRTKGSRWRIVGL